MELFRALGALAEPPVAAHRPLAEALELGESPSPEEHTELFSLQLFPYASFVLGAEGMLGGEERDRAAGFFRALTLEPPEEPDHLTVQLAFYAELAGREQEAEGERKERLGRARRVWLEEHLLPWLPVYLAKLVDFVPGFYRRWGHLLLEVLAEEARELRARPIYRSPAPPLVDPRREDAEAFLTSLLAPARAGFLLTGADLEHAGRTLGLGLRRGERRFVLKALLGQAPGEVLGWLETEARDRARRHGERPPELCAEDDPWARQALASAELLADLASEPIEV